MLDTSIFILFKQCFPGVWYSKNICISISLNSVVTELERNDLLIVRVTRLSLKQAGLGIGSHHQKKVNH